MVSNGKGGLAEMDLSHLNNNWEAILVANGCSFDRARDLAGAIQHTLDTANHQTFGLSERPLVNGECYALLFSRVHRDQVLKLGLCPTVADLRRFANSTREPHGGAGVSVQLVNISGRAVWHIEEGDTPAHVALASMDKSAHVGATVGRPGDEMDEPGGGIGKPSQKPRLALIQTPLKLWPGQLAQAAAGGYPEGVSDSWPDTWIPAIFHGLLAYNHKYLVIRGDQKLDVAAWDICHEGVDQYADMLSPFTKVRWHFWVHPLAPSSDGVTIFTDGKAQEFREWHSPVGPTKYFLRYAVRGLRLMARVDFWRPARFMLREDEGGPKVYPTLPSGEPSRGGGGEGPKHGDLLVPAEYTDKRPEGAAGYTFYSDGECYLNLFHGQVRDAALDALGSYPTAAQVKLFASTYADPYTRHGIEVQSTSDSVVHVVSGTHGARDVLESIDDTLHIGSTQAQAVPDTNVHVSNQPRALEVNAAGSALMLRLPVAGGIKGKDPDPSFTFELSKLAFGPRCRQFESVRLVEIQLTASVVSGDNDSVLYAVLTESREPPTSDHRWWGAPHSLVLAGNVNGSTNGTLGFANDHAFGTELKGMSIGNWPPTLHCKLTTKVSCLAIIRGIITVEVRGIAVGPVHDMNPPPKAKAIADVEDTSDDDEPTVRQSPQRLAGPSVRRA